MRTINAAILAQFEAANLRPFYLIDMTIDGTHYRYTDCDVPLVVGANRYSPRGLKLEPVRYSTGTAVDSVKIEIDNLDDVMTSLFVDGTPQGSDVTLQVMLMDNAYTATAAPVTIFQGTIDGWSLDEEQVSFTVASELVKWNQRTLARHSASCRWKEFKGTECTYAGAAAWCDRSYTRCAALNNQANFGGFRWLPSIVNKQVWWGSQMNPTPPLDNRHKTIA